jgi:hypothetical protein
MINPTTYLVLILALATLYFVSHYMLNEYSPVGTENTHVSKLREIIFLLAFFLFSCVFFNILSQNNNIIHHYHFVVRERSRCAVPYRAATGAFPVFIISFCIIQSRV